MPAYGMLSNLQQRKFKEYEITDRMNNDGNFISHYDWRNPKTNQTKRLFDFKGYQDNCGSLYLANLSFTESTLVSREMFLTFAFTAYRHLYNILHCSLVKNSNGIWYYPSYKHYDELFRSLGVKSVEMKNTRNGHIQSWYYMEVNKLNFDYDEVIDPTDEKSLPPEFKITNLPKKEKKHAA